MPAKRPADSAAFRLESYLPESAALRVVRGFALVAAASSWVEAVAVVQSLPELIASPSLGLIDELARTARKSHQPQTAERIRLIRLWLARQGSRRIGRNVGSIPRRKPPLGWSSLGSLLRVCVRVRRLEQKLAERPVLEHLRPAQRCWQSIAAHPLFPQMPERWRLDALNAAGNCSLFGGDRLRDSESVLTAMEFYRETVERASPAVSDRHRYRYNLGRAYFLRYEGRMGEPGDLHRSVELITAALAETPPEFPLRPGYVITLAGALDREYMRSGSIEHLEREIAVQEEALSYPCGEPIRGALLNFLGSSYRKRFQRSAEATDLQRSIALIEEAVSAAREDDYEQRANRHTNLGSALLDRHAVTGDPADLDRAVETFERAVELTEPGVPGMATRLNNLGNGLSRRDRGDDRRRAVDCYQRACDLSPQLDPQLASRCFNLGNALGALPGVNTVQRRRAAYRRAVATGLVNSLEWALAAARNWGNWALERRAWREAAVACRFGLEALDRLLQGQFKRSSKEAWLREAPALASHAAFALAKVGRVGSAVAVLERGRARLLVEAFERVRFDLGSLAARGHTDLLNRFQRASERISLLTGEGRTGESAAPPTVPGLDELREARREHLQAVRAIRRIPGFQHFLLPMPERQIRQYAHAAPLVYLISSPVGGLALAVRHDQAPAAFELPGVTEAALRNHAEWLLHCYWNRRSDRAAWFTAVDECGGWLGQVVLAPIQEVIEAECRAVLIPGGLLGLLPFGAAWVDDPEPGGRRYFLDRNDFTQVPNVRALAAAGAALPPEPIAPTLAVGDPQPVTASPLPLARCEAALVARAEPGSSRLLGPEATFESVDQALPKHGVLHFACHAAARPDEPLESALYFADDVPLTLQALFGKNLEGVRLALLSACETALPGFALPDEVVSLPSGLLHAGVPGVVASLWAVGDESTMFLMDAFYRLFRQPYIPPAKALRMAQLELREATAEVLATQAAAIMALPDEERGIRYSEASDLWRRLLTLDPGSRPYAHPVYWAGFSYYGI